MLLCLLLLFFYIVLYCSIVIGIYHRSAMYQQNGYPASSGSPNAMGGFPAAPGTSASNGDINPYYNTGGIGQNRDQTGYPSQQAWGVQGQQPTNVTDYQYQGSANVDTVEPGLVGATEEATDDRIVRWSWNLYPTSRVDAAKMRVPLGCMYAPMDRTYPVLLKSGERCHKCKAFINPYVTLDPRSQSWTCVFCQSSNVFPAGYPPVAQILPDEVRPGFEAVEYVPRIPSGASCGVFVIVVDMCVEEIELEGLQTCLRTVISKLPDSAYVCLMTFSIAIQVHDLSGRTAYPRSSVLRGTEEVKVEHVKKLIPNLVPFIVPLQRCRGVVDKLITDMQRDPWPVEKSHRPLRCTGAAISAAASVLEIYSPGKGSCVFAFLSGACTVGPGKIVEPSREFMIRAHADIRDGNRNASLWIPSCAYYDNLMQRLVAQGHSLSCFCASLDQLGVGEMKQCINCSGGIVLNAETWMQKPFQESISLYLEPREDGKLNFVLNVTFDVITSPTWKVAGVIGQCIGTGAKSTSVSDKEIGAGGTCQWTSGMMDSYTTYAVYFHASSTPGVNFIPYRYAQFITRYEVEGAYHTRVLTVCHSQKDKPTKFELMQAFDQETAAVLMAREALYKTDLMPLYDILRWLDRKLVSIVAEFGERSSGKGAPMVLPQQLMLFPAFMFHLRRSGYLQVFNSSPDETAILRLQLLKSCVSDSVVQIQPTLYRYRMDAPSQSVALDSAALQHDCVVLLDTFFEVLLHSGSTISAWRSAGYAEQEEYAYFKEFLETPLADAQLLVMNRFPVPRLIDVCQDDPDARILYNRINPSRSYHSVADAYGRNEGELVYTDDASLQTFVSHLWKLASEEK